jgi:hypothetical protein
LFEGFTSPDQLASLTRLSLEQEKLIRALNWAVDTSNVDLALRLLCSVSFATAQLGFGFTLPYEPALRLSGAVDRPEYPIALTNAAAKAAFRGDLEVAEQWCVQALAAEERLQTHPEGEVGQYVGICAGRLGVGGFVGRWATFYEPPRAWRRQLAARRSLAPTCPSPRGAAPSPATPMPPPRSQSRDSRRLGRGASPSSSSWP